MRLRACRVKVWDTRKPTWTGPENMLLKKSKQRRHVGRAPKRDTLGRSMTATTEDDGCQVTPCQAQWSELEDQTTRTVVGELVMASLSERRASR